MRQITWLTIRGQIQLHIWNPGPQFAYSLYNFYGATITIEGRLQVSMSKVKAFFGRKFVLSKTGPKMAVLVKKESVKLNFDLETPERHILARNRVFWRILCQNPCGRIWCKRSEEPPPPNEKKRVNNFSVRSCACAKNDTPYLNWMKFCRVVDVREVTIYANFRDDRLGGLGARVNFALIPLTLIVVLATPSHYRATVW